MTSKTRDTADSQETGWGVLRHLIGNSNWGYYRDPNPSRPEEKNKTGSFLSESNGLITRIIKVLFVQQEEKSIKYGHTKNWCPVTNIYNIYKKWSRVSLRSPQFHSVPTQFFFSWCPAHAPHNLSN